MLKPLVIVVTAVCMFWLPQPSKPALTAYDCNQSDRRHYESLEELFPCRTISYFQRMDEAYLVVRDPLKTVKAYHCNLSFTQWIVDSRGLKRLTATNVSHIIGREACLEAHNFNTTDLLGQRIPFLKINGTIEHTVANIDPRDIEDEYRDDGTVRGYHYERIYQITLSTEHGNVDFKRNIVKFDGVGCDYSELKCEDPKLLGELYWKPERGVTTKAWSDVDVQLVKRGETESSPEVTYAVISRNGKVFVLKTLRSETYGENIEFQIEDGDLFVISQPRYSIRDDSDSSFLEKLQDVYSEATGFDVFDAVDVVRRLCNKEKTDLVHSFGAARTHPSVVLLPRKGYDMVFQYHSSSQEYKYLVEPCSKKNVSLRETKECFAKIPVKDEHGVDLFLDPLSRVLSKSTNRTECSEVFERNKTMEITTETYKDPNALIYVSSEGVPYKTSYTHWTCTILIYSALLLLLIWLIAVVVRVVKLIVRRGFGRNSCCIKGYAVQLQTTEETQLNVRTILELFIPPLVGKNVFKKEEQVETLPESINL